jgi:hypothetical protein
MRPHLAATRTGEGYVGVAGMHLARCMHAAAPLAKQRALLTVMTHPCRDVQRAHISAAAAAIAILARCLVLANPLGHHRRQGHSWREAHG